MPSPETRADDRPGGWPDDWLVPDWPAPAHVRAVCTGRAGGASRGRHASLNLGDHVGDDEAAVARNRRRLQRAIGARPVFLQQVHGTDVLDLDAASPDGAVADAAATVARGVACAVLAADCLPVLFTDAAGTRVAAAHAGWRGLAGGVLAQVLMPFQAAAPMEPGLGAIEVIAWLGPCIGPRAFEVGTEVRAAFVARTADAAACFRPAGAPGKWRADLPALARLHLAALGVARVYGNDGGDAWCTVRNPSRFFSYRRDGVTGRHAACVWLA